MALAVVALVVLAVLAITFAALALYFVGLYKKLVADQNNIDRSFSNIDLLLKQRHDELPKLVQTCKGYMQHEQKMLQAVTEARTAFRRASTPAEKAQADNLASGTLEALFAVAEKYPDLKANTNFRQLQGRIIDLETKIAAQRSSYNDDANAFNMRIAQVPAKILAGFMGLRPHALFQAAEADREDVKVSFNT